MTSLNPPIPISFEAINSLSQLYFSEKCEYNRNRSAANKAASSPPVPALISKIMFLLSSGSFGNNFILRSFSRSNFLFLLSVNSSIASSFNSSSSEFIIASQSII